MITTILQNASMAQILAAKHWTADHLHIPFSMVTNTVAVAYVLRHFEQGTYSGWDGWTDMLKANAR